MTAQLQVESKKAGSGGSPLTATRESLWKDAMRRLMRNRAAVIGGGMVILLYLIMIFADVIAPYP